MASWTYFCAAELSIQPGNEYIIVSNRFVWALVHMNRIWFVRGTSQKLLSEVDIFVTEYNDIFNLDFGRMVSGLNRDEVQKKKKIFFGVWAITSWKGGFNPDYILLERISSRLHLGIIGFHPDYVRLVLTLHPNSNIASEHLTLHPKIKHCIRKTENKFWNPTLIPKI